MIFWNWLSTGAGPTDRSFLAFPADAMWLHWDEPSPPASAGAFWHVLQDRLTQDETPTRVLHNDGVRFLVQRDQAFWPLVTSRMSISPKADICQYICLCRNSVG